MYLNKSIRNVLFVSVVCEWGGVGRYLGGCTLGGALVGVGVAVFLLLGVNPLFHTQRLFC